MQKGLFASTHIFPMLLHNKLKNAVFQNTAQLQQYLRLGIWDFSLGNSF